MPIRINLKELFSSDPQEINVEKVNFNFNKLLELGIGTPGPIGSTGPQGPAGPIGQTGSQGPRGATWWVGSGDPNALPFSGLIDGDLYLDQVSFSTWEYDLPTNTWTQVASISSSVTTYLNQTGGSPFAKDFSGGAGLNSRFTVFRNRASTTPETGRGSGVTATNDVLFLNNYDDSQILGTNNLGDLYNSLLSISVDHTVATADTSRYHLELSSIYDISGTSTLSSIKNNLKVHFYKWDLAGAQYLTSTNIGDAAWLNTAEFSVSLPNGTNLTNPSTGVNSNGAFRFKTPKLNLEGGSNLRDELVISMGPWEAITEFDQDFNSIRANGITFSLTQAQINSTIGIADNYQSSYTRLDNKDLFMLDTHSLIEGVLINDKTFIIGNTNVIGKVSIGNLDPTSDLTVDGNTSIGNAYRAIQAPTDGLIVKGKVGINHDIPNSYFTVAGNAAIGDAYKSTLAPTDGLIVKGKVSINHATPASYFTVAGNAAIGDAYKNIAAPTNGLIVEGDTGINISSPIAPLHVQSYTPTGGDVPDALTLILQRNNSPTQTLNFYTNGHGNQIVSYSHPDNTKSLVFHSTSNTNDDPSTTTSSNDIIFKIRGVETLRMKDNISSSRKDIGIGTISPTSKLHIVGSEKVLHVEGTTDVIKIDTNNSGAGKALICSDASGSADWQPITGFGVPVGAVMPYVGSTAPTGWLLCDGATIPAGPEYAALRSLTGGNTPNLQQRFIVGVGDNSSVPGSGYSLNATGGKDENKLIQSQIPAHSHEMKDDGVNGASVNITLSGSHNHDVYGSNASEGDHWAVEMEEVDKDGNGMPENTITAVMGGGTYHRSHTHSNADFAGHTGNGLKNKDGNSQLTWDGAGATTAVENRPPYYALNYIIKY
jgi:microcystin-dependent protein